MYANTRKNKPTIASTVVETGGHTLHWKPVPKTRFSSHSVHAWPVSHKSHHMQMAAGRKQEGQHSSHHTQTRKTATGKKQEEQHTHNEERKSDLYILQNMPRFRYKHHLSTARRSNQFHLLPETCVWHVSVCVHVCVCVCCVSCVYVCVCVTVAGL